MSSLPRLRHGSTRVLTLAILVLVLAAAATAAPQRKRASISAGWVKLPTAGATEAEAYLVVDNPTAYDLVLQKPSSEAAGRIELRAAGSPEPLEFVTVPAYGGLEMTATGTYLLLRDLKMPLAAGATVPIGVMTDSGAPLTVDAVVKQE